MRQLPRESLHDGPLIRQPAILPNFPEPLAKHFEGRQKRSCYVDRFFKRFHPVVTPRGVIAGTAPQDLSSLYSRRTPWSAHGRRLLLRRLHHHEPQSQPSGTGSNTHDKHRKRVRAIPVVSVFGSAIQFSLSRGCGATPPAAPLTTRRIARQRSIGTWSSSASCGKTTLF